MSKAELALVIKLQLSQLQSQSSDSHHNDTFYSSVMEMRTKGRVSKSLQQLPPILQHRPPQQQHTAAAATAAGTPNGGDALSAAVIGGGRSGSGVPGGGGVGSVAAYKSADASLGRLQSSSLKKPKKLMELASAEQQSHTDAADDGRSATHPTSTPARRGTGRVAALIAAC